MPSVGEQLRTARESQKLALHEVADWTKIRGDHLRALEEGNYSVFSAPVYIRGFVRTYATILKLDAPRIMDQLSVELNASGKHGAPAIEPAHGVLDDAMFQLSKSARRMALPAVGVILVIVLAIVGYLGWSRYQNRNPLEGLGPGLYQAPPANDTLPLPRSS